MKVPFIRATARAGAVALFAISAAAAQAAAQTPAEADREGVRRAVLDYVEGFYEGDSTKHVRSIMPEVYKYGYMWLADRNRYNGSQMAWPEFHAYARRVQASGRKAPPTAPKDVVIFEVLDQTASAKITASWGIDYLLLAKRDGRWMISHVLWQSAPRAAK